MYSLASTHPFKRVFWLLLGVSAFALGGIGIVVPVLPTTPFILLAAYAFGKSAPSISAWLETHRTFGPAIQDWRTHRAIATRYKFAAVTMMVFAVGASALAGLSLVVLVIQSVCMIAAATYVLTRSKPHANP